MAKIRVDSDLEHLAGVIGGPGTELVFVSDSEEHAFEIAERWLEERLELERGREHPK